MNLSADYQVEAMVAVGRSGKIEDLPKPYDERMAPRPRKPLVEIAFEGILP